MDDDFVADSYVLYLAADGLDYSGPIGSAYVWKDKVHARESLSSPDIVIVHGSRFDANQDLVRGDHGHRDVVPVLENLHTPMSIKRNSFHRTLALSADSQQATPPTGPQCIARGN